MGRVCAWSLKPVLHRLAGIAKTVLKQYSVGTTCVISCQRQRVYIYIYVQGTGTWWQLEFLGGHDPFARRRQNNTWMNHSRGKDII